MEIPRPRSHSRLVASVSAVSAARLLSELTPMRPALCGSWNCYESGGLLLHRPEKPPRLRWKRRPPIPGNHAVPGGGRAYWAQCLAEAASSLGTGRSPALGVGHRISLACKAQRVCMCVCVCTRTRVTFNLHTHSLTRELSPHALSQWLPVAQGDNLSSLPVITRPHPALSPVASSHSPAQPG